MSRRVTRRSVLAGAGAGVTLGLAGCLGDEIVEEAEGTFSIGIMQPMSGDLEYYGQQGWNGFLAGLAYKADEDPLLVESPGVEEIEVGDVTYELHFEDTEFIPDQAQTVAEDLVEDVGVDMLYGCSSSDSARLVIDTVSKPANVPTVLGPAADADITYDEANCGDIIFRAHETAAMDANSGGRYVARETDVESVYVVAADNAFGRSVADNYMRVFEEEGLSVVGERYVEPGYAEFDGIFDDMEAAGADAALGGFTFLTLPAFLETGLPRDIRMIGGFATLITNGPVGEVVQSVLGEDFTAEDVEEAGLGPFTTRYHWNQYDNEINDEFVDTYVDTFGVVPDLFTSGSFAAASSIVQGVEESASVDPHDVAEAMRGMTIEETPKGEDAYTYQEFNNQAASPMTVADLVPTEDEWADAWAALIQPGDPIETVDAEASSTPQDDPTVTCDLS